MKPVTIGIIGGLGKYGRWLERFFSARGCHVIASDIGSPLSSNEYVAQNSDVVIFSVLPIQTVPLAMRKVLMYSRPGQLWMDVTSRKVEPMKAMLESKAEVVGLHPICPPPADGTWKGKKVIVCEGRLDKWKRWVEEFLAESGAVVKRATPEEHDHYMDFIQRLPHAMILIMAAVIRRCEVDVGETLDYASPFYKVVLGLAGRILSQDPQLYADIQSAESSGVDVLEAVEWETRRIRLMVDRIKKTSDAAPFFEEFEAGRKHFGAQNLKDGFELFKKLNGLISDQAKASDGADKPSSASDSS